MSNKNEMIELTALWQNNTKNGEIYYSGYLGATKVLVFANKFKKGPKDPSHRVYLTKKEDRQQQQQAQQQQNNQDEDDLPF